VASPDWLPLLTRALAAGDAAALAAVPKTDLHCHSLLSAPLDVYAELLGRPVPAPPARFDDFTAFSAYIVGQLSPALRSPAAVRRVVRAAFERLVADGVVYAEMSFDLLLPDTIGMSMPQFADLLDEEMARVAAHVRVAPEIGINRALPAEFASAQAQTWITGGTFRGIDLYGDETLGDVRDFAPLYGLAADHGLKRKAHSGEICPPDAVRATLDALRPDALHHGVRAAEDPALLDHLAARGTVLHVCPTSNIALRITESLATHPVRALHAAGVAFTVNTDDFTIFGASACDEILNLRRIGFSAEQIGAVIQRGLDEMPG
jgi:adenosine deaminase